MSESGTGDWVVVDGFVDVIHADIVRGRIEAEGIPAILGNRHLVSADWLYSQAMGGVQIMVPLEHVVEARDIIADIDAGEYSESGDDLKYKDICTSCGGTLLHKSSTSWKLAFFGIHLLSLPFPFRKDVFYCPQCKA